MLDVRFTLKSGAQIQGHFDNANSLYDINLSNDWLYSNGEFEVTVNTTQIAAMEIVGRYS